MLISGTHQATGKAIGLASSLMTLRRMCDDAAYNAFLAGLAPETRAIAQDPPNAETWLPLHHWMRIFDSAHRLAFGGDDAKISELSEVGMVADLRRLQSRVLRFTSPQFVMTRAAKLWVTYCHNNGHVETVASDEGCEIHFVEVVSARVQAFLPFQRGVTSALLKLCGKQHFSVRCLPIVNVARQTLVAQWQD